MFSKLKSHFRRRSEHETDYDQLGHNAGGLPVEYFKVIETELRRLGIPESSASLEVVQVAMTPQGRGVYAGQVRLVRWDDGKAIRLLLGLPILERRVRRALQAHWVLELSNFSGLWLHAAEGVQSATAAHEIRAFFAQVNGPGITLGSDSGE
ncbi:hypothetical protein JJB11_21845 [Ramlibacter ginsenosidimutans]|uniref:Uncharacterized protein n=1 Tax=Ramlibacter ginsenosidimutans TaxID=502333 RepID=A0A934WPV9_9BURK|nr:hypothetical protein [Ramlibacter ginsenosidimutans]MBK6008750.1 hypothetical protein [Ramlibacter ginsenosidimutans]